jgi:hypothetical protein
MRRSRDGYNAWPAIADLFLGILAIVVFLMMDRSPPDDELARIRSDIRSLGRDHPDAIKEIRPREPLGNTDTLVFTENSLSFDKCRWDIPLRKQAEVREIFRALGAPHIVDRIHMIRIEGHADSEPVTSCLQDASFSDNLQLSQNRARAVYNVMLGLSPTDPRGLASLEQDTAPPPPEDLAYLRALDRRGCLLVAGFGDRSPLDELAPRDPRQRRVEITIEYAPPAGADGAQRAAGGDGAKSAAAMKRCSSRGQ